MDDLKNAKPDVKVIAVDLGSPQEKKSSVGRASATLQARLDSLLTKKEELKPQWWTEWEFNQPQEPS